MHGRVDTERLATIRDSDDQRSRNRRLERTDAGEPVVAIGALHGAGLAHPVEPDDWAEAPASATASDMGGVRASGRRLGGDDRGTLVDNGVASLGRIAGDTDAALCPEGTAGPVGTPISVGGVLRMLERQRFRCALSGRPLSPETSALDHVVPIRLGGGHVIENTQVLHKDVNRAKGSMAREEFIGLCAEVVQWSEASDVPRHVGHGSARPAHPTNPRPLGPDAPRGDVGARS